MSAISKIQNEIISDFAQLEDPFDQYAFLLKLSSYLPVMDEEKRKQAEEVKGCQSHVWLDMRDEYGRFVMEAESDTMLIRGFLYLIREVVSGQPLEDVAASDLYFLKDSGLVSSLSADRRKGIGYIAEAVINKAKELSLLRSSKCC